MEQQNPSTVSAMSGNSSLDPEKLNKSRTVHHIRHKSVHFEGDRLHDENTRSIYINDPKSTNEKYEFSRNEIRTSRYTLITFVPKNLFIQFHRVAYLYFLAIAVLNQLPPLAVFGRTVSLFPLLFVLCVTAVKDGYEDWRRHRSDQKENNRESMVFQSGQFKEKKWKDIQTGEVLKILSDETIPCDMVLLGTSDPSGIAFIQTMNLDGESNLKIRHARQETALQGGNVSEGGPFSGHIKCEQPNRNIYEFTAYMEFKGLKFPLSQTNILLRGCQLKNTKWVIAVAVYTGKETKAMLNSTTSPSKRSKLERHMNRETFWLSILLFLMCLVVAVGTCLWLHHHKHQLDTLPYYRRRYYTEGGNDGKTYRYYGIPMETFFSFLSSIIVFQIMIPISLYITMELVRLGQSFFMIEDQRMCDAATGIRFQCRSLNINEDLGQIRYIFSDKTGTLTENKMEFCRASVCGKSYGGSSMEDNTFPQEGIFPATEQHKVGGRKWTLKSQLTVDPKLMDLLNGNPEDKEVMMAHEFFLTLALCNTVIPISSEGSDFLDFQGESPDEQALVAAASAYGFTLFERTPGHVLIDINGRTLRLDVMGMHEFDSVRKRMSAVVRFPDGAVKVFVKGADTSMVKSLRTHGDDDERVNCATKEHLTDYSCRGLRTLVIAARDLHGAELDEWEREYGDASTSVADRPSRLRHAASLAERDLDLLGATGVEDRLQDGVPETIECLRKAGVKVWVLTGDKQETAISIALSSNLLLPDTPLVIINGTSEDECRTLLSSAKSAPPSRPPGLVIDGNSLVYILEKDLASELFDVAVACSVVVCCRVAPLQKAGIVDLVKSRTDDVTLAIGDGANDASMIQMADVGIGICGQEGRQAVMASDFAMAQFRFLGRLLLVHGHWNYHRIGYLILYNFYRNAVFVLVLFWYVISAAYSTASALTDWSSVFYSVIYTSVPTVVVGVLDKDLSHRTLVQHPKLYGCVGRGRRSYSPLLFWTTMADTLWQSLVLFYAPVSAFERTAADVWTVGSQWTIAVVVLVTVHLAMDVQRWFLVTHAAVWGSVAVTFISLVVLDSIPVFPNYWTVYHVARTPVYWLTMALVVVVALLPRFLCKAALAIFWPSDIRIAREAEILRRLHRSSC